MTLRTVPTKLKTSLSDFDAALKSAAASAARDGLRPTLSHVLVRKTAPELVTIVGSDGFTMCIAEIAAEVTAGPEEALLWWQDAADLAIGKPTMFDDEVEILGRPILEGQKQPADVRKRPLPVSEYPSYEDVEATCLTDPEPVRAAVDRDAFSGALKAHASLDSGIVTVLHFELDALRLVSHNCGAAGMQLTVQSRVSWLPDKAPLAPTAICLDPALLLRGVQHSRTSTVELEAQEPEIIPEDDERRRQLDYTQRPLRLTADVWRFIIMPRTVNGGEPLMPEQKPERGRAAAVDPDGFPEPR